jgi:hypothetical protein
MDFIWSDLMTAYVVDIPVVPVKIGDLHVAKV